MTVWILAVYLAAGCGNNFIVGTYTTKEKCEVHKPQWEQRGRVVLCQKFKVKE